MTEDNLRPMTTKTVKEVTFNLLRRLKIRTIVGNPGSTEETFLQDFPDDFDYILALQEASVVGIADGLSQRLRRPVIVNLHTAAGLGNAMGALMTAHHNKTPLIITAGQQSREMLLSEPFLTNIESINLPKPFIKWSYEPSRPEDVPGAFMRAYAVAMQAPQGPVFLSLPLDDWNKEMVETELRRTVATRQAPDPQRMTLFAQQIDDSRHPVIVYGADVARSEAWEEAVRFAEHLCAPVWMAPFSERNAFPETHPLFQGTLPSGIGSLSRQLDGHDLLIVIGAPVFRYYPWIPGSYLPNGARLLHVTDDPDISAKAVAGDSLVGDARLFLQDILGMINKRQIKDQKRRPPAGKADRAADPIHPHALLELMKESMTEPTILVEESPSVVPMLQDVFRLDTPDTFYAAASGCLGWGLPAAVGIALGERQTGTNRPVLALMGDGSFQYSPQALYTAVQQQIRLIVVVFQNEEYGILKQFAILENTPNVPGLDLPGLDCVSLAKGYGASSGLASSLDEFSELYTDALHRQGVTVIVVPITKRLPPLY